MSRERVDSAETLVSRSSSPIPDELAYGEVYLETCKILKCSLADFLLIFEDDDTWPNTALGIEVHRIIKSHLKPLRGPKEGFLYKFVQAMIDHALDCSGHRYVLVSLHFAEDNNRYLHGKGDMVVNLANAWLHNLFIPSTMLTPNYVEHFGNIPISAPRFQDGIFASTQDGPVARREQNRCALTGLSNQSLQVVPIIPFVPYDFNSVNVDDVKANGKHDSEAATGTTWNMFKAWTGLDSNKLVRANMSSPANAIYMTFSDYDVFGRFEMYLNHENFWRVPSKYEAHVYKPFSLSDGKSSAEVEFGPLEDVDAPNTEFIRAHAALAKVIHVCGGSGILRKLMSLEDLALLFKA